MDYKNKSETYYSNLRGDMLSYIGKEAGKVLEIGCGNGVLLDYLKKNGLATETWGVDLNSEAEYEIDKFLMGKIEDVIKNISDNYFDTIICNDVLEHLFDPKGVLIMLKQKLATKGKLVASIPNIRHISSLQGILIKKDFKYTAGGIMDFTHLKFFTKKSIERMFNEAEYDVKLIKGISISPNPLKRFFTSVIGLFLGQDIRYVQFAVVALNS